MNLKKILGLVLVAVGVVILIYRGFNYKKNHTADLKIMTVKVQETEHVNVPAWVGILGVVAGVGLLLLPTRSR